MAFALLCDDDPAFGGLMKDFLGSLGHECEQVLEVSQLKAAVERCIPAVVFVDMQMQGGGGAAAVRLLPGTVPVVVVSGMPVEQQRRWFSDRPGTLFVEKPVDFEVLETLLKELMTGTRPPPPGY